MNMNRKVLVLTLALSMSLVLGGCGGTNGTNNTNNPTPGVEDNHHQEHTHGNYEWIGEFDLKAGTYLFHFGPCEDETMAVGFIKMGDNITDLEHHASHLMSTDKETIKQEAQFEAKPDYAYTFEMDKEHGHIHFTINEDGTYAIVTEHLPNESDMQILDKDNVEIKPIREHEGAEHSH